MAKYYTSALLALTSLASFAAIPVRWTTDAYKVKPLSYECYHGETLDMAAALTAYGEPLDFAGKTAKLYWQTNGMEAAWWSTNAQVRAEYGATNILAAVWSGEYDTGAERVTGFIGLEGENYRAAFELKFRASPGFSPSTLPTPTKTINWSAVVNENINAAPFALKGEGGGGMTTNAVKGIVEGYGYETATNAAATYQTKIGDLATIRSGAASGATAVQPSAITDMATKTWVGQQGYETSAHASATYQPKGDYLTSHQSLEPATNYANRVAVAATNYANTAAAGAVVAATNAAAAMANAAETSAVAKAANMTNDAHIVRGNIAGNVWDITVDQSVRSGTATLAENIPWTGVKGTPTTLSGYGITDAYTKTEADGEFVNAQTATNIVKDATNALATVAHTGSYEDLNNRPDIPSTNGFIYAEGATNAAEAVVAQVLDYALTNLTAASLALASGEIGNYTTAADFTLALDFAENGRSGDCLLYVANTDAAADHTITLTPNTYTFVSADIAKARTLTKATTNIVSFTRLTATTVLVSKLEVK